MMKFTVVVMIFFGTLLGCVSTDSYEIYSQGVVDGAKVVALAGPRHAWTVEIEKRLRKKGYSVKRFASVSKAIERVSADKIETYNESSARVVLFVDGFAPNTSMTRCFGGGYKFDFISAEVIDTVKNETLATYSSSGFSEGCAPLSGTIFGDIIAMVEAVFR